MFASADPCQIRGGGGKLEGLGGVCHGASGCLICRKKSPSSSSSPSDDEVELLEFDERGLLLSTCESVEAILDPVSSTFNTLGYR